MSEDKKTSHHSGHTDQFGVRLHNSLKHKIALFGIVLLALAIPLTVVLIQQVQDIRQRASEVATPPFPPTTTFGKAASLLNSYFTAPTTSAINPNLGFTVEAWVKPGSASSSGYIVSKGSSTQNSFHLALFSSPNNGAYIVTYEFRVVNSGNNCAFHRIVQQKTLSASEITRWHHLAGVIQTSGAMDIFVNGQRSTMNTNAVSGICARDIPISVGARTLSSGGSGYINGEIDEVRISSVSRYENNFQLPSAPFIQDPETVALWHFDGDVMDASSNGHDGQASGVISFIDSTIGNPDTTPTQPTSPTLTQQPTNIPTVTEAVNTPTKTPTNIPTPTNPPTPTPVVLSCTISDVSRTGRQISVRMRNSNLLTSGYDTYRYEFFNARGTRVSTQNKPIASVNQLDTFTNVSPSRMVVTARVGNNPRIRPISCGEKRF